MSVMSEPTSSNPRDMCGTVVATCMRNALKRHNTESTQSCGNCTLVEGGKSHPASYRGCSHAKGELQRRDHNELPRDHLEARSSLSSPHQSSPMQLHCIKTRNTNNHRYSRQMGKTCGTPCSSSICDSRKFRGQICQHRFPVRLIMTR
jgi:hypothetical protein